jgi:hypothetical protein
MLRILHISDLHFHSPKQNEDSKHAVARPKMYSGKVTISGSRYDKVLPKFKTGNKSYIVFRKIRVNG